MEVPIAILIEVMLLSKGQVAKRIINSEWIEYNYVPILFSVNFWLSIN